MAVGGVFNDDFHAFAKRLAAAEGGVHIAPIRHHSPACAFAVRQMIREINPRQVLIEAPIDFERHIDHILHKETRPPVAVAALIDKDKTSRLAAYYPFCTHSPEYVAMVEARAIGARICFIDLPSTDKAFLKVRNDEETVSLLSEAPFDSSDFVEALRRHYGCRDGYELWDHLFESQLGCDDWRRFFSEVGSYCAGLRAATPEERIVEEGDAARERHMLQHLQASRKESGPIVAVVGGFHAPALMAMGTEEIVKKSADKAGEGRSYLIRYSFEALDALSGYSAGLPQPGYYQALWNRATENNGPPDWRATGLELVSAFTREMRRTGLAISVPAQVEMLRAAESLAHMRGRPGVMRHDLIDGARTALVKGETSINEPWIERLVTFLRGTVLGDVTTAAGSPPLVEDARRRASMHRIDVSDGARRRRKLDIRRKASHLAASRYFHAMSLLESEFAEFEGGPDFLNNAFTDRLFEEWSYAWSPRVEGRLIELSAKADRLPAACLAVIEDRIGALRTEGQAGDIAAMTTLISQGLIAGLGAQLKPLLRTLADSIAVHADFASLAVAFRQLHFIGLSSGLLSTPKDLKLDNARDAAYRRLVYLCNDLPDMPEETIDAGIEALRIVSEILRHVDGEIFDQTLFDDAIDRVVDQRPPPEILGAILALLVKARRRSPADLNQALRGRFSGSGASPEGRIGVLRGVLAASPDVLWREEGVINTVDDFLTHLSTEEFLDIVPFVRRAFASLNPRETDKLAAMLSAIHGGRSEEYVCHNTSLSEKDLSLGLSIDRKLRDVISADGLETWLAQGNAS